MPPSALPEAERWLGLYAARDFQLQPGAEVSLPARQAGWYFAQELVATPLPGRPVAGFGLGIDAFSDVRRWAAQRAPEAPIDFPPLVWIAAPEALRGARLDAGGVALHHDGGSCGYALTPKIALNRSYWNASSLAYFAQRPVSLRGARAGDGRFVVRSIWPEDFRFGPAPPPAARAPATTAVEDPAATLRRLMREHPAGGAQSPYAAMTLWQREAAAGEPAAESEADWAGRPVLGLMVNGAQGDDDEAHGGHFAIVTGRIQADGQIGDWLVNNFYSLDVESEKGILAAPVPLDNYLGDLNAGQGWYRPSVMLAVVLRDERAAALVQSALNRVFNQFWRHQLVYYHPNQNCASISIDTLRALGWPVPARGPASRLLAWLGYPAIALKERSVGKAKLAFDYLRTDLTRLLPAVALEQACASLLALVRSEEQAPASRSARFGRGPLAAMLAQDALALALLRLPQFPSSRAFGDAPAISTWEYRTRVPNDPALAQIVPVPPRPFPAELRDPDLLPPRWTPADYATLVWALLSVVGVPLLVWRWWRRRRRPADGRG